MANSPGTSANAFASILKNSNTNNNNNNSQNNNNNNNNNGVITKFFNSEKITQSSTASILRTFRGLIKDTKRLDEAVNYLYKALIDDAIVGVFLETHHLLKTGNLNALEGVLENDSTYRIIDTPNYDIFGISTAKKPMDCICPNCDRPVSASRFAPHLEKCMGMGRISSRIASRRLATKEVHSASSSSSSSYQQPNANSDDEDDVEWASEKRRKKNNQNSRNNGSKKNNGKSF